MASTSNPATAVTTEAPASSEATSQPPVETAKPSKIKTFFEHVGDWFKEHLGSAASFEKTASTAIGVANHCSILCSRWQSANRSQPR